MKSIVIVDTSVFFHVVEVAEKPSEARLRIHIELLQRTDRGDVLLLPVATIVETGNLIAQRGDGTERRTSALRYARQVRRALAGVSPFEPTRFFDVAELAAWLDVYPEYAMREIGMGDLSLIKEWEHQRVVHPAARVQIWSLDGDLAGYDTHPD
jgi:hypothetical protein